MAAQGTKSTKEVREPKKQTPTFLLELPLVAGPAQAKRLRAHLEAGRQLYNALLSEGQRRLRQMRADPAWQAARAISRSQKQERRAAFSALREQYGFSEYGLRFVLEPPEEGNRGSLIWKDEQLEAVIDWEDEVVTHGLSSRIKYARLVQRKASSERAQGADALGFRYVVQLACEGIPHHKKKHGVGSDTIGADLGPSTIALFPRAAEASLAVFCEELAPDEQAIRRLERQMDRQRRAANPGNYDTQGRIKKGSKTRLRWKTSKNYEQTRQRRAAKERKLAAQRKSLHGRKVHEIVAVGNTVILEKLSYKAWQKQYGRSVGLRAPGMFVAHLRRTGASHGRHPDGSLNTCDETLAVLSWLWALREKTARATLASVCLRHWSCATGSLCRVSGFHAFSRPTHPLVCPDRRSLGGCGSAPAGRARAGAPTCE